MNEGERINNETGGERGGGEGGGGGGGDGGGGGGSGGLGGGGGGRGRREDSWLTFALSKGKGGRDIQAFVK